MARREKKPGLSPLENEVMNIVWQRRDVTADDVRNALARVRQMKDSTVRTLLRRLEEKGFVDHSVQGRTYYYVPKIARHSATSHAVRSIIDRFCDGSVENLLVGMVDSDLVSAETLKGLAKKIAEAEAAAKRKRPSSGE